MNNSTTTKLEDKIMSKIKNGQVKLRSKYIFLAEKLGLGSAFALSVVLAVLFLNLFFFYLKTTDNLEYLSFGSAGIYAFLESFPYLLVISFMMFLFLAGYLLAKTDFSYKKPFGYFAASLIIFSAAMGGILACTEISEKIEEQAFSDLPPGYIFKPFLKRGIELRNSGVAGKISEIGENYLIIETPISAQNVDTENLEASSSQQFIKEQFIMVIGERKGDIFVARAARIVGEKKLPMIRRGIQRRVERDTDSLNSLPVKIESSPNDKEAEECVDDDCAEINKTTNEEIEGCIDDDRAEIKDRSPEK